MTPLRWVPRFIYGPSYTDFTLTYPVTRWSPGGRSIGRAAASATHVPANIITLQKRTLSMTLRFTEDEWWDSVRDFLFWIQRGYPFLWFPNDLSTVDDTISYTVIADFPRVKDAIATTRDGALLWLMTSPITLLRLDGLAWDRDYMTLPAILPEASTAPSPARYIVSADDYTLVPGGTTTITVQLVDDDDVPIHRAGHFVRLSVTGAGGSVTSDSGVTDHLGMFATVLHGGAYAAIHTVHSVHVIDEDGRSGVSSDITVITGGTAYAVTVNLYERLTTQSVVVTAQLKRGSVNAMEAGHTVTWAKTAGVGGAFSAPTSVTDALGKASVTFTFGTSDTNYTISGTDEFGTTGISAIIHAFDEGLGFLRAISSLEFAVDVAVSAVLSGGGALIGLRDHSGKDVAITLVGGGHNPVYEAAGWVITGGTMPRLVFDHATQNWFLMDLPTLPQPLSTVLVFDGFAISGSGQQNAINLGGLVVYYHAAWAMNAGSIADSAFVNSDPDNQGKLIRIDVANGVFSHIYRGSTDSGPLSPNNSGAVHGFTSVGARYDGADAVVMKLAAMAIYSKVLSAPERADIIAGFAARYPGVGTT